MIYMATEDLGWRPLVASWLERRAGAAAALGAHGGAPASARCALRRRGNGCPSCPLICTPLHPTRRARVLPAGPSEAAEGREVNALVASLVERYMEPALEHKRRNCRRAAPVGGYCNGCLLHFVAGMPRAPVALRRCVSRFTRASCA